MAGPIIREGRTLLDGWTVVRRYLVQDGGQGGLHPREVVHRPDIVAILPFSRLRGTVTLVSQARVPVMLADEALGAAFVEAPSGRIDPGESAYDAACRELREETGWNAATLDPAGCVFLHPALTTERAHLFTCDLDRLCDPQGPADTGDMLGDAGTVELTFAEAEARCRSGAIADAKTLLLIERLGASMRATPAADAISWETCR